MNDEENLEALRRSGRRRVNSEIRKKPGVCIIGRCARKAVADPDEEEAILCPECKKLFRPHCAKCDRELTDHFAELGLCGFCFYAVPAEERDRITELARRRRAAAWWAILVERDLRADRAAEG